MGKQTPSASDYRETLTDLPTNSVKGDCPTQRKGDIEVTVLWEHDRTPVKNVPIDLKGPTPGNSPTAAKGKVRFKKRDLGEYSYTADFSNLGLKYPVGLEKQDSAGVFGNKLTKVTLLVEERAALRVRLIWKEDDKDKGPPPDTEVISISGGGKEQRDKAEALVEMVPPGTVTLAVRMKEPWGLLPGQDLTAVLTRGQETLKVLYVAKAWVALELRDADTDKPVGPAKYHLTLPGPEALAEDAPKGALKRALKPAKGDVRIDKIETGQEKPEDPLYEFVERTSE